MGIEVIFKIGAIGIIVAVVNQILKHSGKDELATFTTLAGVIICLFMILDMIIELFDSVKTLFSF